MQKDTSFLNTLSNRLPSFNVHQTIRVHLVSVIVFVLSWINARFQINESFNFKYAECSLLTKYTGGPGGSVSYVVGLSNNSYKPITKTAWVRARLCKLQKGCTRLAVASDKVYPLLAHGRRFSPDTPASSTTKTGRHDIAEILLKVALITINQIKSTKCTSSKLCI
jgi:hypothetical protein